MGKNKAKEKESLHKFTSISTEQLPDVDESLYDDVFEKAELCGGVSDEASDEAEYGDTFSGEEVICDEEAGEDAYEAALGDESGIQSEEAGSGTRGKKDKGVRKSGSKQQKSRRAYFTIKHQHSEETFKALAHMQYDLFCRKNYVARTLIALGCMVAAVLNIESWWAYLLIVYAAYLATGKYNQANHTARKLANGIRDAHLEFPSSRYIFEEDRMRVLSVNDHEELEPLPYGEVERLGRDSSYYYIFKNSSGGFMIPREQLGDRDDEFVDFIKERTNQGFYTRRTPPIVRFVRQVRGQAK